MIWVKAASAAGSATQGHLMQTRETTPNGRDGLMPRDRSVSDQPGLADQATCLMDRHSLERSQRIGGNQPSHD